MKPQWINLMVGLLGTFAILAVTPVAMADDDDQLNANASLRGFSEVPAVSTTASGRFKAEIDGSSIKYELSYSGLEGEVQQAHIHFAQKNVNGGVSVFLCTNLGNGPAGTQTCPASPGKVSGTLVAADVIGPTEQGIAAGEFDELVRAIRAGVAYANVHSTIFPGGEIRGQIIADDD